MSDAISKAIEALRMTKYCIPAYGFHAEKVTIDEAIAGLQALQSGEPVVDEAVFDILKAAQGSCRLGFNDIADKQIEIAIKALLSAGEETV